MVGPSEGPAPAVRGQQAVQLSDDLEKALMTAGQRKVNLIWEYTQATIALFVVGTTMVTGMPMRWVPKRDPRFAASPRPGAA